MKKTNVFLLVLTCILTAFGPVVEQERSQFQVSLDGMPIGSYSVKKTVIGNMETFVVETETAAGLIGRMSCRSVMKSSFQDHQMVSCQMKTWVNDNLESSVNIKWVNGGYTRQEGAGSMEICSDQVGFSSAQLFFEEPQGRDRLFHESYGKELPLIAVGNHQYEMKLPNGGVERYTYINGSVSEVQLVRSFTTIIVKSDPTS